MIIGYARVSTDGQTLDAQLAGLRAAGAERIFSEKISGAVTDRKALGKAIAGLGEGDVLLVTRLDRLARSTRDLLNVLDTGRNQRDERMTRKMLTVYRGHINNYILHPARGVGSRKLSQFTARSVGELRDHIRTAGVTISQDWIATNAAHGVKVIGPRSEGSKKIVPPSKDDMRAVIDAAGEDLRLMLIFAASTGARAGEQWAARWARREL